MIENILSRKLQDHIPKCLMVSFKDFNMLNQESYDVEREANARSQELTNRMLLTLLNKDWVTCLRIQGELVANKISGVGTNFGLLVNVLPGSNNRFVWNQNVILS